MDPRPEQGAPHRGKAARWYSLDQLLQRLRRCHALRRIQAVGLGPRDGPRSARAVHRSESRLRGDLTTVVSSRLSVVGFGHWMLAINDPRLAIDYRGFDK